MSFHKRSTFKVLIWIGVILCPFFVLDIHAQGGKAEPKRIQFDATRKSQTLAGTLSNAQEMEYVFEASKGQKVVIKNSNRKLFDFRVFNLEYDFDTEFESSPTLTFQIPEKGEYMLFVRKKQVQNPKKARFSISITLK